MGALAKALSPSSSYAARKTTLWDDLTDRIAGAMLPAQLDEVEAFMAARPLDIPGAWREPLEELIEKKREEIAAEEIGAIMRERYDF